jgi:hypothetical protein
MLVKGGSQGKGGPVVTERPEREHRVPAGSRGSARRHRVEGGRQRVMKLRLTDAEWDALAARAERAKVSMQRFLVETALTGARVVSAPQSLIAELAAIRRLLGLLGNNVNQIARALNSGGHPDAGAAATLEAVRRLMKRLDTALGWLGVPPQRSAPGSAPA